MTTKENENRAREIYNLFNEMNRNDGNWAMGRRDISELVVSLLSRMVNGGSDEKAFCEFFAYEHRTLQQAMFSLFLGLCKEISNWDDYKFDGRNEAMREAAKKIMETLKYSHLPLI